MLYYPSAREGVAWLEASDETWAEYAAAVYAAAAARAPDETLPEDAGNRRDG